MLPLGLRHEHKEMSAKMLYKKICVYKRFAVLYVYTLSGDTVQCILACNIRARDLVFASSL